MIAPQMPLLAKAFTCSLLIGAAVGDGEWTPMESIRSCKGYEKEHGTCNMPPCVACVPVNCEFGDWDEWQAQGGCTGLCERHRGIKASNNECGMPCNGFKTESKECLDPACKLVERTCLLTDWSQWSSCDSAFGQKSRFRELKVLDSGEGQPCEELGASAAESAQVESAVTNQTVPCGEDVAVDCAFGLWGEFTKCSASCDGGWYAQMRKVVTPASNGGQPCEGPMRRTLKCNEQPCEATVNCVMGQWSDWIGCDEDSPTQQKRERKVVTPASGGGLACNDTLAEVEGCTQEIPAPCVVSEWSAWSECDKTCDGGQAYSTRQITTPAKFGGPCNISDLKLTKPCNDFPCVSPAEADCKLSDWSAWGLCSASCGVGEQVRNRTVLNIASSVGKGCVGFLSEVQACTVKDCNVQDCVWNDWEDWGDCTCTCGGGSKRRQRTVKTAPLLGGQLCDVVDKDEVAPCNTHQCESCADGKWSVWSEWSACSATCESGYRHRHRTVIAQPNHCGKPAAGLEDEYETCSNWLSLADTAQASIGQISGCNSGYNESALNDFNAGFESMKAAGWEFTDADGGGWTSKTQYRGDIKPICGDCPLPNANSYWGWDYPGNGRLQLRLRGSGALALDFGNAWKEGQVLVRVGDVNADDSGAVVANARTLSVKAYFTFKDGDTLIIKEKHPRGIMVINSIHFFCPEAVRCNDDKDCQVSQWTDWSSCSCSCFGVRERHRDVTQFAVGLGKTCATMPLKTVEQCNPVVGSVVPEGCGKIGTRPCEFSQWSEWEACPVTCGGAQTSRKRMILTPNEIDGEPCSGKTEEFQGCGTQECDESCIDCQWGPWSEWSGCGKECISQKYRRRHIAVMPNHCGLPCDLGAAKEATNCTGTCPVEKYCSWTQWADLGNGACSAQCGAATRLRQRSLAIFDTPPADGALITGTGEPGAMGTCNFACGGTQLKQVACPFVPCDKDHPPVDCKFAEWGPWGDATWSQLCERKRVVDVMNDNNGKPCDGPLEETKLCAKGGVPKIMDCVFSEWEDWSICASPSDQKQRTRRVAQPAVTSSSSIEALYTESPAYCDGDLESTSKWDCDPFPEGGHAEHSGCEAECTKRASCKAYTFPASGTGTCCLLVGKEPKENKTIPLPGSELPCFKKQVGECKGPLKETGSCAGPELQPVDCSFEHWTAWTTCTESCGGGIQQRSRGIATPAAHGGSPCGGGDEGAEDVLQEVQACNTDACPAAGPVDCVLSPWTLPGNCSGHQVQRFRQVIVPAANGGKPCVGPIIEIFPCQQKVDCVVSDWTAWDACDQKCNTGQQTRHRQVTQNPMNGGEPCNGTLVETQGCNTLPCSVVDCNPGDWSTWGPCISSTDCGKGQQSRSRTILQQAQEGGSGCLDDTAQTRECDTGVACTAVDCKWQDWADWSSCTCSCGGGQKERHRDIAVHPLKGGTPCEPLNKTEIVPCNTQDCPKGDCVDGLWDDWQDWAPCSATCLGGVTNRFRKIIREANQCGKVAEGNSYEVASCNSDVGCTAPVDCLFDDWESWGGCTMQCNGVMRRSRGIAKQGAGAGAFCVGSIKETAPCNQTGADCGGEPHVDCQLSDWTAWTSCPVTCGGGQYSRSRTVVKQPSYNGQACPNPLSETAPCSTQACPTECEPQDCKWGDWSDWGACDKCGGQQRRFRRPVVNPKCGGAPCDFKDSEFISNCTRKCHERQYCGWAEWGDWSSCSTTCGQGTYSRTRELTIKGLASPDLVGLDGGAEFDEAALEMNIKELAERAHQLEGQRVQELSVSFGSGLAVVLGLVALTRTIPRTIASGDLSPSLYRQVDVAPTM